MHNFYSLYIICTLVIIPLEIKTIYNHRENDEITLQRDVRKGNRRRKKKRNISVISFSFSLSLFPLFSLYLSSISLVSTLTPIFHKNIFFFIVHDVWQESLTYSQTSTLEFPWKISILSHMCTFVCAIRSV